MNLLEQLDMVDPEWRDRVSSNPLEAAVELGIIDAEDLDPASEPLEFHDE